MEVPKYCTPKLLGELEISETWYQLTSQIVSTLLCALALPLMYWACHSFESKSVPISLRILLYFHHIAHAIYAVSYIMTQTYHLVTRIFYDDCDLLVSARKCVIIRLFQSFSSAFFHNFYVAVSCHSFFSIFNWYKDGNARFWGYLAFLIALGGTSPSYLVDKDSDDYMLNCSSFEHKTKSVQMQIFRLFMFVDLASVLSLSLLKLYRYLEDRLGYHLSKKHRKLELDRVMFLIGPNFLLNVICCLYLDIVSLYATTEEKLNGNLFIWANSVPLYIFLSPIVWFKTLSKQENRTSPEAVPSVEHFDVLEGFWHFHERNRRKKVAEWRVRIKRNKIKEPKVSVAVIDVESNKASEIA